VPEAAEGDIRVASFNLYEYFNGDGKGAGFPGERGAQTAEEFLQQAARIAAAVKEMHPDVLGVMEVENDGFEATSARQDLAIMLSEALGVPYKVAKPEAERAGTDVISVGLIYRSDRVSPHGPAHLLEGGSFGPTNRVPIAQVFRALEGGDRFLVVVNHLKSKGYCPESGPDTDQDDGQACWNAARVEGATETVRWAQQLAAEAGTENLLMLGDLNAYRMEDPIRALIDEGLVELVQHHQPGRPYYSYVFRGAAGTLDYAFASAPLAEISSDAFIWHINAAYPWSDRPSEPWLRSSDHDPVVVDLRFTQSETPD
jgi:predicted extracellular nuclease